MRMLFEMDKKDYDHNGSRFYRPSARGIIIVDGKVAMVHSRKYDYYKFPGGGIQADESMEEALIREVLEETGLRVIENSIKEYGKVRRIHKCSQEDEFDIFVQENYYFLCSVEEAVGEQSLDEYEADEEFTLEFVKPQTVIDVNRRNVPEDEFNQVMLEREARVMELLVLEGYL